MPTKEEVKTQLEDKFGSLANKIIECGKESVEKKKSIGEIEEELKECLKEELRKGEISEDEIKQAAQLLSFIIAG
ncbi:MAG: hypothetical protein ACFFHD_03030 [Promethearchaeota archaeon]